MARVGCLVFSLVVAVCCFTIATCKVPSRKILAKKLESLENEFKSMKSEVDGGESKIMLQFAEREASMREDFAEKIALVEKKLGDQIIKLSEEINQRLRELITDQLGNVDEIVNIFDPNKEDGNKEKTIRENGNCSDTLNCRGQAGDGDDSGETTSMSTSTVTSSSSSSSSPTSSPSSSTSSTTAPTSSTTTSSTTSLSTALPSSATTMISATRGPSEPRNRILISRYFRESRTYFKQYHIDTGKTNTYPNLRGNNILAMTYDPTNRRIIFTRDSPSGIYAATLDGTNPFITLLRNVGSEGLFVDEKRKLLFFTTYEPNNTISRITTSGDDYRIITSLYNKGFVSPRAVTVDSEREIIYYNFRGRPWSMDFDGNNRVSYSVQKYGSYACGVDDFTNTLYYNDDKLIVKRDMTTGNTTILQELREATRNIIWYDNTLYMSGWDHGGIYILDLETNEMTKPVKGLTDYDHVIALLP